MKIETVFPKPNIVNVATSGKLWDFSSRTNVYFTNGSPTLIININKEELKTIKQVLKKIKRIGSYSYEVEFEGRKFLAKIKIDGREINIEL